MELGRYLKEKKIRVILASGSPRRTELLAMAEIPHEVIPSGADENDQREDPAEKVKALSCSKAEEVYVSEEKKGGDLLVLGADTVVSVEGRILGKPVDEEDAARMLRMLSGRAHEVFTGVTIQGRCGGEAVRRTFSVRTVVHVSPLSEEEIQDYIREGESLDKAGAYGIQGHFLRYVSGIEGDYYNVVGLPISRVYHELKKVTDETGVFA
jgi:septum formation protein